MIPKLTLVKINAALVAAAATMAASVATADTILGVYASADYWQYDGTGDLADNNGTSRDFSLDKTKKPNFTIRFEHPVPLLPNVRLRQTDMPIDGTGSGTTFSFLGNTFGSQTTASGDLSALDATLYYEILDTVVSADIGINVKLLDGNLKVTDTLTSTSKSVDLDYPLPMLYASAGGKLPFTGWSAKADAAFVSYDGSSISDAQAEIQYDFIDNMAVDVGLKVGYRMLNIKLNDVENIDADLKINGPYIGLQAHF